MSNFLTDVSFIQAVVCICVTYLIGRFISDYFDYIKAITPASVSIVKADIKTLEGRIERVARQLTVVMNIINKKETRNGKTEEE